MEISWILIVAFLSLEAAAEWSPPIELTHGTCASIKAVYTDPSTGHHHIIWTECKNNRQVNYWKVDGSGNLLINSVLDVPIDNNFGFYRGSIVGNGKDLFAKVSATRLCNLDPMYLCDEPALTESHDGGTTWTPLALIQRKDMKDVCSRVGDNLLYLPNTGRVYFFYTKGCVDDVSDLSGDQICFVTKPSGSTVFGKEMLLHQAKDTATDVVFSATTLEGDKRVLHVFWGDRTGDQKTGILHVSSCDNGLTWTDPKPVYEGEATTVPKMFAMAVNQKVAPTILATFAEGTEPETKLWYTSDFTKTVEVKKASGKIEDPGSRYYERLQAMAVCGTEEKPMMFMLTRIKQDQPLEYSAWDMKTMTGAATDPPFPEETLFTGVDLTCYVKEGKAIVTAFYSKSVVFDGAMMMAADTVDLAQKMNLA